MRAPDICVHALAELERVAQHAAEQFPAPKPMWRKVSFGIEASYISEGDVCACAVTEAAKTLVFDAGAAKLREAFAQGRQVFSHADCAWLTTADGRVPIWCELEARDVQTFGQVLVFTLHHNPLAEPGAVPLVGALSGQAREKAS